jgi:hypothetical protein
MEYGGRSRDRLPNLVAAISKLRHSAMLRCRRLLSYYQTRLVAALFVAAALIRARLIDSFSCLIFRIDQHWWDISRGLESPRVPTASMPTASGAAAQDESLRAAPPGNKSTATAYQTPVQSLLATHPAASDPTTPSSLPQ